MRSQQQQGHEARIATQLLGCTYTYRLPFWCDL